METGFAILPLACFGGPKFLVGRIEAASRIHLVVQTHRTYFGYDPTTYKRMGFLSLCDLIDFVRDPDSEEIASHISSGELECGLRRDGDYITLMLGLTERVQVPIVEFRKFAEAIVGPVSVGTYFV